MNFAFPAEEDSSKELKEALVRGIDAYVKIGRPISEAKANAIVETVEAMLVGQDEPRSRRRKAAGGGRGGKGRARNKLARWTSEDLEALRNLDWDTLDAIWESHKEGNVQQDADLKADQKKAVLAAYAKVPGDKRAERSENANIVGRLKHLVSAYEMAEGQGWSA